VRGRYVVEEKVLPSFALLLIYTGCLLIDLEKTFDVCNELMRDKTSALSDSMKTDDFAF